MPASLVGRFEHLPNRPRSDDAIPLLEKIASQVKPIMSKRSWTVGTLAEFLPSNPSLLGNNMNAGHRINLRLRPPGATSTFYEYDQLVLVMLHELTHIEHGPHDAKFYKLLGEVEEEFYDLKRKGYSGEGFHGSGNHLSGFKASEYEGRAKGLVAAQKRLDTQKRIGKGGILGGTGPAGRSMKEVLAAAAERRMRDDKACHPEEGGYTGEAEEEVRKAAEESVGVDAVDLERERERERERNDAVEVIPEGSKPSLPGPTSKSMGPSSKDLPGLRDSVVTKSPRTALDEARPRSTSRTPAIPNGSSSPSIQPLRHSSSAPATKPQAKPVQKPSPSSTVTPPSPDSTPLELPTGEWSCPSCTLFNAPLALSCDACATPRPKTRRKDTGGEGWWCEFCGAGPREMGFWSCSECGWVRKWG